MRDNGLRAASKPRARRNALLAALLAASSLVGIPSLVSADPRTESPRSPGGRAPHGQLMADARAQADALVAAERQRRKALDTPSAERQRRTWRTAFSDLSGARAATLARQTFRPMIEAPGAGPLHTGKQADEYVNEHLAVVEGAGPGGENAVVTSAMPFQAVDETGELAPVDVTLERTGDGWAPINPVESYAIGGSSADAVDFGSGVTIGPGGADVAGRTEGETIFYPNTQTDTDAFVKSAPDGVELFWQLRSRLSPEDLRLEIDLPAGAELAGPAQDGVAIVRDGEQLGFISAPVATDAEHLPVPTRMRIDGRDVIVEVDHQARDVAYPIAVDPQLVATFDFPTKGLDAFGYWSRYVTGRMDVWGGDGRWGRGLNIVSENYVVPGAEYISFNHGDKAGLYYTAPGAAKIFKVTNTLSRNITGESLAMCMIVGIANAAINNWEGDGGITWGEGCGPFAQYAWTVQTNYPPTAGNTFLFGAYRYSGTPTAFFQYFRDATIYMIDEDLPGISSLGTPPDWTNGSNGAAVNVAAGDYSTGIKTINVIGPSGWSGSGSNTNPNCVYGPCSQQWSVSKPIGNMPEGTHTITVAAADPSGNATPQQQRTIKVDKTPPQLDLRGFLLDAEGLMTDGVPYDLVATVTDPLSGPQRVELRVDGAVADDFDCPSGPVCVASLSWTPTAAQAGSRTITISATDRATNGASSSPIAASVSTERANLDDDRPIVEYTGPDVPGTPPTDGAASYCGPGSLQPSQPCEAAGEPSTSDAAIAIEDDIDEQSPLIVGDPAGYSPTGTRAGGLGRNGKGWGISDQKIDLFTTDAPFFATGTALNDLAVDRVRLIVPWDTVIRAKRPAGQTATYERGGNSDCENSPQNIVVGRSRAALNTVDAWIGAAIDEKKEPLISFEHTHGQDETGPNEWAGFEHERCALPTPGEYEDAARAFLRRYRYFFEGGKGAPRLLTAWNEPNYWKTQPTSRSDTGARRAGRYYTKLNTLCEKPQFDCTVAAGDFLDLNRGGIFYGDINAYAKEYKKGAAYASSTAPKAWAIHPYTLGLRSSGLSQAQARYELIEEELIGSGNAAMWFTEAGGFYSLDGERRPASEQVEDLCLLIKLAKQNGVNRFYQYQLRGIADPYPQTPAVPEGFDTGLMDGNGVPRDAYPKFRYYSAGDVQTDTPCS